MKKKLYAELATLADAYHRCAEKGSTEWKLKHAERIESLVKNHMPSGSGIDCGTKINLERSHADRLVFHTSYHHMTQHGMYDGWTEHIVFVMPTLTRGFNLRISGINRNEIKDYLHDVFDMALRQEVAE